MAFKPNRDLLNVNFEGYKLSESTLRHLKAELKDGVKKKRLSSDCFSFQHVRQATMTNLLFTDPWNESRVYWTTQRNHIMTATIRPSGDISVMSVFQDYRSPKTPEDSFSANPSLVFLSQENALFFDPTIVPSDILLLGTGNRGTILPDAPKWQVATQITLPHTNFTIETAQISADGHTLDIITSVLSHPEPSVNTSSKDNCTVQWHRVVLSHAPSVNLAPEVMDTSVLFTLQSSSIPLYCELFGTAVLIVSESELEEATDKPRQAPFHERMGEEVEEDEEEGTEDDHRGLGYSADNAMYTWDQTVEDVSINVPLADDVSKKDISCVIETDRVVAGLTDGTTYVRGELFGRVDPDSSAWTFEKNKLEIVLEKEEHGVEWSSLLSGPKSRGGLPLRGEGLGLTEEEMRQLEDRIGTMRSEREKRDGKRSSDGPVEIPSKCPKPTFQSTLEECDVDDDRDVRCVLISQEGTTISKTSLGGKQLLFALQSTNCSPSYLCIKHDIDALLYSLDIKAPPTTSSSLQWTHTHTFSALGYVQASKRDKKFLTCASDCSYAVLTDCNRHVFVYLQPPDGLSGLSAVQYVHTLCQGNEILGVCASVRGVVFVLCEEELHVLVGLN